MIGTRATSYLAQQSRLFTWLITENRSHLDLNKPPQLIPRAMSSLERWLSTYQVLSSSLKVVISAFVCRATICQSRNFAEGQRRLCRGCQKARRPRYAYIPGIADRLLVANLDAISTIEKAVIAAIEPRDRVRGCRSDDEVRELAFALSRNINRFAFPDDFTAAMRSIRKRILAKHGTMTHDQKGRPTNEGVLLTALREIRVACSPSWSAAEPNLTFYFVFNDRGNALANSDDIVGACSKGLNYRVVQKVCFSACCTE